MLPLTLPYPGVYRLQLSAAASVVVPSGHLQMMQDSIDASQTTGCDRWQYTIVLHQRNSFADLVNRSTIHSNPRGCSSACNEYIAASFLISASLLTGCLLSSWAVCPLWALLNFAINITISRLIQCAAVRPVVDCCIIGGQTLRAPTTSHGKRAISHRVLTQKQQELLQAACLQLSYHMIRTSETSP